MNKEITIEAIKVMQAYVDGKDIQSYNKDIGEWFDVCGTPFWNWTANNYRVKPTKTRIPLDMTDFDGMTNIWIRQTNQITDRMVTQITNNGLYAGINFETYRELLKCSFYSTDRINWKPCYKEVD